jgi:hypothetical protein
VRVDGEIIICPYGEVGDGLWVKETWIPVHLGSYEPIERGGYIPHYADSIQYAADTIHGYHTCWDTYAGKWRSSLFLCRWMSRITRVIDGIRAQRLQDITEADALAEGISVLPLQSMSDPSAWYESEPGVHQARSARESYALLWDSINAKPKPILGKDHKIDHYVSYPWEDVQEIRTHRGKPWYVIGNPLVWTLSFKRIE